MSRHRTTGANAPRPSTLRTASSSIPRSIVCLGALCLGLGCGSDPIELPAALSIEITFPPTGANLGGVDAVSVAGRVRSDDDIPFDASEIDSITVNGLPATLDPSDPSRWSVASVDVSGTASPLITAVLDAPNAVGTLDTSRPVNRLFIADPAHLDVDEAGARAVVVDTSRLNIVGVDLDDGALTQLAILPRDDAWRTLPAEAIGLDASGTTAYVSRELEIIEVDLTTGARSLVAEAGGGGSGLGSTNDIAVDDAGNRLLVADEPFVTRDFLTIDLTTLANGAFQSEQGGGGQIFDEPTSLAMDAPNTRVLVTSDCLNLNQPCEPGVVSVDLVSGLHTIVSEDTVGDGPLFAAIRSATVHSTARRMFSIASSPAGLLEIDLDDGDREVVWTASESDAFDVDDSDDIEWDAAAGRLIFGDRHLGAVVALEPDGGTSEILSMESIGAGPRFVDPTALDFDPVSDLAYVADEGRQAVVTVDVETGDRTDVSSPELGIGPPLADVTALVLDKAGDRVLVSEPTEGQLIGVDLLTGERVIVSANGVGTGPSAFGVSSLTLDAARNRVYATKPDIDAVISTSVISIDLATGDRENLAADNVGEGEDFMWPRGLVYDATNDRILVADDERIMAVDPISGDRVVMSGRGTDPVEITVGAGPDFEDVQVITLDPDRNRALVTDLDALWSVDLDTGDRTLIAKRNPAPRLDLPEKRAMVLDADRDRLLVADTAVRALGAVNLSAGAPTDGAVLSK